MDDRSQFRDELVRAGLLIPGPVRGVFGRSGTFEGVVAAFERLVDRRSRPADAEEIHFPPVFARAHYACLSHVHHFPDLMGSIHAFTGDEAAHRDLVRRLESGEDWARGLASSDVMMVPAACYPLYPTASGVLPEAGRTVVLVGWVFRHEPSDDPARMMMFRQREIVRLGTSDQVRGHRDAMIEQCLAITADLGLPARAVVANDPFFGRGGRLAKATQREQELKYEIVVPIVSEAHPTAIASSNDHLDIFGRTFDIRTPDGAPAHTGCQGWGLERVALALFRRHGTDPVRWPAAVRRQLWPESGS